MRTNGGQVSKDDRYLLLYTRHGCRPENLLWAVDLEAVQLTDIKDNWVKVVDTWDGECMYACVRVVAGRGACHTLPWVVCLCLVCAGAQAMSVGPLPSARNDI